MKDRVMQVTLYYCVDRSIQGCGEQHRLVVYFNMSENPLDLRKESHIGHAIGFIYHDAFNQGNVDSFPVNQIDKPSRSCNNDVDSLSNFLNLFIDVCSAVDSNGPEASRIGKRFHDTGDLIGQLSGRGQH